MTYIKLNEQKQTIEYPPINKDNICNYNLDIKQLKKDGYKDIDPILIDLFEQGKGRIQGDNIIDISNTEEYKSNIIIKQNNIKKLEIQKQIDILDLKRIRAIVEDGNYSNTQTYLEYYTEQIKELRKQISLL